MSGIAESKCRTLIKPSELNITKSRLDSCNCFIQGVQALDFMYSDSDACWPKSVLHAIIVFSLVLLLEEKGLTWEKKF